MVDIHKDAEKYFGHKPRPLELVAYVTMMRHIENSKLRQKNYNPHHGPDGRFTSGSGSSSKASRGTVKMTENQEYAVIEFEKIARHQSYESIVAVDEAGDVPILKDGETNRVLFTPEEVTKMRQSKGLVISHNHPSSNSFSPADITTAAKTGAKSIRIVSKKYQYELSPGPSVRDTNGSYEWGGLNDIELSYYRANEKTYGKYRDKVQNGTLDADQAGHMHSNDIITSLAKKFGWSYTRKELKDV